MAQLMTTNVIDLSRERAKRNNPGLIVDQSTGRIYGSTIDSQDRLLRIESSLQKIDRLMIELKKLSQDRRKSDV